MDKKILLSSVVIGFGLLCAGFFPGYYYYHTAMDMRTVSVKGLAEKDVRADLAIWNIRFQVAGNDILVAMKELKSQQNLIEAFLTKAGFDADEIIIEGLTMQDAYADSYRDKSTISARYTINQNIMVRSKKVDLVNTTFPMIGNLVSQGVIFNSYGNNVSYVYTKLNDIKPEMLKQATINAKAAADEFANNSGSKVGKIRKANQGVFSITAREQAQDQYEGNQIDKKVRVVSTVEYFLE